MEEKVQEKASITDVLTILLNTRWFFLYIQNNYDESLETNPSKYTKYFRHLRRKKATKYMLPMDSLRVFA